MALTYRLHRDEDLPCLQRLWEEETNWGTFSFTERWHRHVKQAPFGGAIIVIATDTDTGQLVGQFEFLPWLVSVNGREMRAFRPGASIVAKAIRFRSSNPFDHPVAGMYQHAIKALGERGDGLFYTMPDPSWMRFFRMFPMLHCSSFPLWSRTLPLEKALPLGEGYTSGLLSVWDERVDRLWNMHLRFYGCSVVRDSRSLQWKIGGGNYTILSIEKSGEMVGLVTSRQKGNRQWLVCDVLAADTGDSLRATLAAVCNLAHSQVTAEKTICKVAVLVTPIMEPVVRQLGFIRDAYDFPFVTHILNPSITKEDVALERWYVSAND